MSEEKNVKRIHLLHRIMKTTHMYSLLIGFLIGFVLTAIILWLADPAIKILSESLWYCFVSCTTIGFGDVVASSVLGRILTAVLTLYGILLFSFIPGVLVNYFVEFNKIKAKNSVAKFLDKLERLDELTEEERKELALKIREKRYKL